MDIDADFDLISQFRTMNTNDKDYLVAEFKRLSNTQLPYEGCLFYLDLAEWNLNTALWAYYEYDPPADLFNNIPQMKFLCDITIGEGESVAPGTKFVKTWRIKNSGNRRWPYGCQLRLVNSNLPRLVGGFEGAPIIQVNPLNREEEAEVSVELKSPEQCGIYQSQYRLFTPNNTPFGDVIWLVLNVEVGGVLGITQQLNSVSVFGQGLHLSQTNKLKSNIFNLPSNLNQSPNNNNNNNNNSPSVENHELNNGAQNEQINNDLLNNNYHIIEDEKRPDFYDDMFS